RAAGGVGAHPGSPGVRGREPPRGLTKVREGPQVSATRFEVRTAKHDTPFQGGAGEADAGTRHPPPSPPPPGATPLTCSRVLLAAVCGASIHEMASEAPKAPTARTSG